MYLGSEAGSSYTVRTALTASETYYVFDYTTGTLGEQLTGDYTILEDNYSYYYETEAGDRVDLEKVIEYYTDSTNNRYEVGDVDVLKDSTGYYFENTYAVTVRYYLGENTEVSYAASELEERYCYEKDGETVELERFMEGIWYLLYGDQAEDGTFIFGADTPILKMAERISELNKKINDMPLWELYFHQVFTSNPFVVLQNVLYPNGVEVNGRTLYNLNDAAISDLAGLIEALMRVPSIGN